VRFVLLALVGLGLAGCASTPVDTTPPATTENPNGPFGKPTGTSRNTRVGFVDPPAAQAKLIVVNLLPHSGLKNGEIVVSRMANLKPTSVLKITQISNRTALATVLRGEPHAEEEVVLPSSDLTKAAQELPERRPDS